MSSYVCSNKILAIPLLTPPQKLLPLLQKLKAAYLVWFEYYQSIPKTHRYTLGSRIDDLLVETIESISIGSFSAKPDKLPHVRFAIRKLDTTRVLLMILWETRSLDNKKYLALSIHLEEVGRMLGGWHGQLIKQNSPQGNLEEK